MKNSFKKLYVNDNSIIFSYIFISLIMLLLYLFLIAFKCEDLDFTFYKKGYMYFVIFEFIIFSFCILHFDETKCLDLKLGVKGFIKVLVMTLSGIPLILTIFICGNVQALNFWIPLMIQILYGFFIVSFKMLLNYVSKIKAYSNFIVHFSMLFINIFSLLFLYVYSTYSQMVLTTVYDKDIPSIFFINPILTIGGYVNKEITMYSQIGIKPVIVCVLFFSVCILINMAFVYKLRLWNENTGGKHIEVDNH